MKLRDTFSHTPRSLLLAWKSSTQIGVGIILLTVIASVLPIAIAYVGKLIIDAVVAGDAALTTQWVVAELGIVALQALVQRGLFLMRSILGARLGTDVNVQILEKAVSLDLQHFEDAKFYDMLTRARREASSRPVSMVTDSLQLVQNILTLASYGALLFSFSSWAVLGLVLAALPATLVEMRFSNAAFRLRNWRSPDNRKLNYVEYVLANDEHTKEVKTFGLGAMLLGRYKELAEKFYAEDKTLAVKRSGWAYLLSLLATFAFYGCYFVMALQAASGKMSLGNLALYVVAFRQGQQSFQSCLTAIGSMYESNLYMTNLFEFLAIPVTQKKLVNAGAVRAEKGIRFENVGFQYPGRTDWALRNIDLFIPAAESLALVGHNGAGKTTFIKLLCRLYDPSEGRILLDGIDLRSWEEDTLRARMAVVFQDFNQYQFSFRENVGIGSVEHLNENDRVLRSVERGGATEVLALMSAGLETPLGKWFKDGVELSGGQWQKIALSRGFMREQADILILDEPTAALDAMAEQAVFERFQVLSQGKTAILISHRFPTVRMAHRIIVIEGGKLVEQGSHEQLVALKGRYAELFTLQAKGYL